jgi:hypothetical protein
VKKRNNNNNNNNNSAHAHELFEEISVKQCTFRKGKQCPVMTAHSMYIRRDLPQREADAPLCLLIPNRVSRQYGKPEGSRVFLSR